MPGRAAERPASKGTLCRAGAGGRASRCSPNDLQCYHSSTMGYQRSPRQPRATKAVHLSKRASTGWALLRDVLNLDRGMRRLCERVCGLDALGCSQEQAIDDSEAKIVQPAPICRVKPARAIGRPRGSCIREEDAAVLAIR